MGTTVKVATGTVMTMVALAGPGAGAAHADGGPVVGGGSGIALQTSNPRMVALCTMTAVGYDHENRLVGITAGHCAEDAGVAVWAEAAPHAGPIGFAAVKDVDHDWAVIELDPARVTPVRQVGPSVVATVGAPAQAMETVCKNGRTTGFTCGVVWDAYPDEFLSQVCANHGDSGGPVLRGDQLVGMINAGVGLPGSSEMPCTGPGNPFHDPDVSNQITAVLAEIDRLGVVGAGFRPL
ncbi:S1 family peptidase [Nocardia otitidiscaviarum]|uniref:S1 family peptidase n=1 Tax=Nocardia otitidiscaviarum TaxID=1823 RepID=UPI0005BE86A8|nr:serine protease [Nocardia otitidiscaviarum]